MTARRGHRKSVFERAEFPDMNPGPVLRLDREGMVERANEAAGRVFGEGSVKGASWLDLCPGMTRELWVAARDGPGSLEHKAMVADRCLLFHHVSRPDSVFVFGSDVTELELAQRRVAEQAAQLAEVARFPDMNPGPVLRLDLDANVLLANAAARKLLGEELVGRCWRDLCLELDAETWRRILVSAEPVPLEARFGEREYVFAHRRDLAGQLVFVYGTEVTLQRHAERALRQSEKMAMLGTLVAGVAHELNNPAAATRRAAEQMRDSLSRLEEEHRLLDAAGLEPAALGALRELELTARERARGRSGLDALARSDGESAVEEWLEERGVAEPWEHAPALVELGLDTAGLDRLAAALGGGGGGGGGGGALAAALAWAASAYRVHALLHEIGQGTQRISEIVGALKGYSYLGQAPVQAVDIHEGLDNTLVILRSKLKDGITVRRDYCSDLPPVPVFGSELNQVWTNLLDNAADAMGGRGAIVIRTRRRDGWAVVEVEDDGPGIPADALSRVFEPFYTTKAPGRGTGLGLSTSYSIVTDKHRGTIAVESRPGFTRFTVRLPLEARGAAESEVRS